jgi:hypothetical protein
VIEKRVIALGAAAFAGIEGFWSLGHRLAGVPSAWVMKTGLGTSMCFIGFIVASSVTCVWRGKARVVNTAAALLLGALAGIVVSLLIIGPGNLWPIVVAFDGAIVGFAIALGAAIAGLIRSAGSDQSQR